MKSPIPLLALALAAAFSPLVSISQTAAPAQPSFTDNQLTEGIKSGLNLMITQTITAGSLKAEPAGLLKQASDELTKANKADTAKRFATAYADSARRLTPQVAEVLRNSVRDFKVADPKALLTGQPKGITQAWRDASRSSMREAILPAVRREMTSSDLGGKAKAMMDAAFPGGVKGSTAAIGNIDYQLRDRLIDEALKLIGDREAEVRKNPDLIKGNALAQRVFDAHKK